MKRFKKVLFIQLLSFDSNFEDSIRRPISPHDLILPRVPL